MSNPKLTSLREILRRQNTRSKENDEDNIPPPTRVSTTPITSDQDAAWNRKLERYRRPDRSQTGTFAPVPQDNSRLAEQGEAAAASASSTSHPSQLRHYFINSPPVVQDGFSEKLARVGTDPSIDSATKMRSQFARPPLDTSNPRTSGSSLSPTSTRPDLSGRSARVTKAYWSDDEFDLNLEVGHIVYIDVEEDKHWFSGHLKNDETQRGIFPRSHVTLLDDAPAIPTMTRPERVPARAVTMPIPPRITGCGANCPIRQVAKINEDRPPLEPPRIGISRVAMDEILNNRSGIFTDLLPSQTRLVRLTRGTGVGNLACDLLIVDLVDGNECRIAGSADIVRYEALSYSWLSDKPTARISVNGLSWAVPTELANALLYLRTTQDQRYLWCDALCINQHNRVEKASQIRSMLRIFEKAEKIIAWLGTPQPSSGRLVKAFSIISPKDNLDDLKHDSTCLDTLDGLVIAFRFHLRSNWFLRTWVRQEVFAAQNLALCMGGHEMSFSSFNKKFDAMCRLCTPALTRPIEKPITLDVLKREFQHFGSDQHDFRPPDYRQELSEHWLSVLSAGSRFGVSEDRDRIYAALGIVTCPATKLFARLPGNIDGLLKQFPISYEKEKLLGEVFGDVTKVLVNFTGMANALDFWRMPRFGRSPCEGLPSWAIDWRFSDGVVLPSVISMGGSYERKGLTNQPEQDLQQAGPLKLQGVKLTSSFSHIRALRKPDEGQGLPVDEMLDKLKQGVVDHTLTIWIEEKIDYHLVHLKALNLNALPQVTSGIQQGHYCLVDASLSVEYAIPKVVHFLVARSVQVDDFIVSFYGSQYLHLIRPCTDIRSKYQYLGPVIPLAHSSPSNLWNDDGKGYWAREIQDAEVKTETFELV